MLYNKQNMMAHFDILEMKHIPFSEYFFILIFYFQLFKNIIWKHYEIF